MHIKKLFCVLLIAALPIVSGCGETKPKAPAITLSAERLPNNHSVFLHGTGFTPRMSAESHLRRPNATEFPVLEMLPDDKGEFTHEIESWLLMPGKHDVWVIDKTTGVSSNVASFEVTQDQPPPSK